MVGALNKIPQTIIGISLFKTPLTKIGAASIVIGSFFHFEPLALFINAYMTLGLFGGVVYSYSKNKEHWRGLNSSRRSPYALPFDDDFEKEKY